MISRSTFEVEGETFTVHKAPEGLRAVSAIKIVFSGRHVSYLSPKGDMYSSRIAGGSWYIGRRWRLSDIGVIEDAVELGVLPRKVNAPKLRALKEKKAEDRKRAYAAAAILRDAEVVGMALLPAQRKSLRAAAKKIPR